MRPHHNTGLLELKKRSGEKDIFDFSANLNPFVSSFKNALFTQALEDPQSFEPHWNQDLLEKLSTLHGVSQNEILITCGATEAIHLAVRSLKLKSGLVIEPTSLEYRFAMNLYGVEVRSMMLRERTQFHLTMAEMFNALHAVGFLAISNPNSPTASEWTTEEVDQILNNARLKQIAVILDETHVDWKESLSAVSLFKKTHDFLIIRSLSKFYGMSGLRLGYIIGPENLIEEMKKLQYPNAVLPQACAIALDLLNDNSFKKNSLKLMAKERAFLESELSNLKWMKLYPSNLNFFLVKLQGSRRNQDLQPTFEKEGIWVRDCVHYPGLDNHFFRFAIKTREENEHFVKTLKSIS